MTSLKLIFMGTPEFALPTLRSLVESEHEILAVYSQPPRPAGRGQQDRLSPVHAYAVSKSLKVLTPATLKTEETQEQFRSLKADAAIVAAYGLLLPEAILHGTRMGCINVHPSLLPRWRGAAPIQRTIMAGDKQTAIVIMQMNAGLDTGDMLMTQHYPIADGTTAGQLHDRLAADAGALVLKTIERLAAQTIMPVKQPETGVTYAGKITKEECRIDWRQPARALRNKILGLNPHPGAYFNNKGEAIKILGADIVVSGGQPGMVIDDHLTVACGQDALTLTMVQRPGKKPMAATDMLKGYPLGKGTALELP